jgi:hypothetical protein
MIHDTAAVVYALRDLNRSYSNFKMRHLRLCQPVFVTQHQSVKRLTDCFFGARFGDEELLTHLQLMVGLVAQPDTALFSLHNTCLLLATQTSSSNTDSKMAFERRVQLLEVRNKRAHSKDTHGFLKRLCLESRLDVNLKIA